MLAVETSSGIRSIGQKARAVLNTWVSVYTGIFYRGSVSPQDQGMKRSDDMGEMYRPLGKFRLHLEVASCNSLKGRLVAMAHLSKH